MDRMRGLPEKMLKLFLEEFQGWMNNLLKEAFDEKKFMAFIRQYAKSMGIDLSRLPSMVGQPGGFDPYVVLGLDKSASDEEVKKRYRDLTFHLHPDTAGREGTSFLLQMVLAAYKLIEMERGWK